METLTREQAIQRIRDISEVKEASHLGFNELNAGLERSIYNDHICRVGAVRELMAIFDIKEDEL